MRRRTVQPLALKLRPDGTVRIESLILSFVLTVPSGLNLELFHTPIAL